MRREPKQETKRHTREEMMRRDVAKPADPERKKGDGMKAAFREPDGGKEKGRPAKPMDPGKKKGDGVKEAMAMQGRKPSKLSPMGAAKKAVR